MTCKLGNCALGAVLLKCVHGGRIRRIRVANQMKRHWITELPNGEVWHFKRTCNILPKPFHNVLFIGEYQQLVNNRYKMKEVA